MHRREARRGDPHHRRNGAPAIRRETIVIATQIDLESPWVVIALAMSTNDWETLKASRDMSASTERSYMAAYKRLRSGLERSISETG